MSHCCRTLLSVPFLQRFFRKLALAIPYNYIESVELLELSSQEQWLDALLLAQCLLDLTAVAVLAGAVA